MVGGKRGSEVNWTSGCRRPVENVWCLSSLLRKVNGRRKAVLFSGKIEIAGAKNLLFNDHIVLFKATYLSNKVYFTLPYLTSINGNGSA